LKRSVTIPLVLAVDPVAGEAGLGGEALFS